MSKRGRKPKIQQVQERIEFNTQKKEQVKESKVEQVKEEPKKPEKVMVDTKGHIIFVNGIKFAGKAMVPKEYVSTVKRLVQKRQKFDVKAKQYQDHPDKKFIVPGR